MRLNLFVKSKYESITIILSLVLDILCVTYFLTSIAMPDLPPSDTLYTTNMVNDVSASSDISSP